MKTEHWYGDYSHSLFPAGERERHLALFDDDDEPHYCCTIEGDNWEDCHQKFEQHLKMLLHKSK